MVLSVHPHDLPLLAKSTHMTSPLLGHPSIHMTSFFGGVVSASTVHNLTFMRHSYHPFITPSLPFCFLHSHTFTAYSTILTLISYVQHASLRRLLLLHSHICLSFQNPLSPLTLLFSSLYFPNIHIMPGAANITGLIPCSNPCHLNNQNLTPLP